MILHHWPLSTIYDILLHKKHYSLNSDIILWCTISPVPKWWLSFHFPSKQIESPALKVSPLLHRTSCTPTNSNLYLANSLATLVREPDLCWLLTFHVSNLMSLFDCWGRSKGYFHARGTCICFIIRWGVVSTSPKPQAGGPPLVGCPRLLIQYIRIYPPYWRPFVHPQLRTCHAVATGNLCIFVFIQIVILLYNYVI